MQPPRFGQPAQKPGLWRRTPPALFAPVFGAFGLAAAWRRAADAFAVPTWPSELLFGAVSLLFVFILVAYGAKVLRRPGVVPEDLRVLPGRSGLAALGLSGMLMALGVSPLSVPMATGVLLVALAAQAVIALLVVRLMVTGPDEGRVVTPVWHLLFVGFVIAPLTATSLGWKVFSTIVFWVTLGVAVAIWGASLAQFARRDVPAPLRPLLAMHLAQAAVLGMVAMILGFTWIAIGLGVLATLYLAVLMVRARWVTEAGFSPLWSAFSFPLAAYSGLMQMLGAYGAGEAFRVLGGLALVAATLAIPVILWKVLQLWAKGQLAVRTNAAEA